MQNIIASFWSGTWFYDKLVKNIYFHLDEDLFLLALVVTQDIADVKWIKKLLEAKLLWADFWIVEVIVEIEIEPENS